MIKKILILMSDSRKLSVDNKADDGARGIEYNSLSALINYKYSIKHNYDFLYLIPKLNNNYEFLNCKSPSGERRHPAWSKLLSILFIMINKKQYNFIIYLDTDCIVNNFDINLYNFLKKSKNIKNLDLNLESNIFFLNDMPWYPDLPCSGFIIIKNNIESFNFIKNWYMDEKNKSHNQDHPFEQSVIQRENMISKGIEVINDWMFELKDNNQFLLHIGSHEKHNRESVFLKKLDKLRFSDFNFINHISLNYTLEYNTDEVLSICQ